jgi:hypothetical protein
VFTQRLYSRAWALGALDNLTALEVRHAAASHLKKVLQTRNSPHVNTIIVTRKDARRVDILKCKERYKMLTALPLGCPAGKELVAAATILINFSEASTRHGDCGELMMLLLVLGEQPRDRAPRREGRYGTALVVEVAETIDDHLGGDAPTRNDGSPA